MRKIILAASAAVLLGAPAAIAGTVTWDGPKTKMSNDNDSTPALILLGLLGVVIASTAMGGLATRNDTEMLPGEAVDE